MGTKADLVHAGSATRAVRSLDITPPLTTESPTHPSPLTLAPNPKRLQAGYPVRVDCLTTVWTVLFTQPSRYHWMLSYYMRAEGLALSWVGTGRCLFSLDFEVPTTPT